MPGCSGQPFGSTSASAGAACSSAGPMTGSTDLGPIQAQQDSLAQLDDRLFADRSSRPPATPGANRRRAGTPHTSQQQQIVQLTPLWEYVVRTKKFPREASVSAVFAEISERLRDPEWEVRQHALRVLCDVLPTFPADGIDRVAGLVLPELVGNLGHPAPAVRKGSLDALRIYLLHSPRRDEMTRKILQEGLERAGVRDDYQTGVATGVILATPLLLFPSRTSPPAPGHLVREAIRVLAMRLVQVTHQESALRSLARIRDAVGEAEFGRCLAEIDDSMRRNFELLYEVYGLRRSALPRRRRATPKAEDGPRPSRERRDSLEQSIREIVPVDKSWDTEDSDTSGIAEEDEDNGRVSSSASVSSSARVVLETEIKFDEETAITMTILEDNPAEADSRGELAGEGNEEAREDKEATEVKPIADSETAEDESSPEERRKTPKRVHFGGEIVKLRTPDSEDAESVLSADVEPQSPQSPQPASPRNQSHGQYHYHHPHQQQQQAVSSPMRQHQLHPSSAQQHHQQQQQPRTRIPLPVFPATRMPQVQPYRRPRSSSQPVDRPSSSWQIQRQRARRRSASSSPRREAHTHRPELSPKKSILSRGPNDRSSSPAESDFDARMAAVYGQQRLSRRDSVSPRIVIEEVRDSPTPQTEQPSFRVCEEEPSSMSPRLDRTEPAAVVTSPRVRSPSPAPLGEPCVNQAVEEKSPDSVFGEPSGLGWQDKLRKDHENMMRAVARSRSALDQNTRFDWEERDEGSAQGRERRRSQSAKIPGYEVFPRQERNYILMELSSPVKERSRRTSLEDNPDGEALNVKEEAGSDDKRNDENNEAKSEAAKEEKTEEERIDSNKLEDGERRESDTNQAESDKMLDEQLGIVDEDLEKAALDAKERSSDSSSDGEWKQREPSWEELGIVDDEILQDFHNKEDWRARVRGLERIASALRAPAALNSLEPRLGSLLLAVLGGERSCRVAGAGLGVARVVLAGVSEEALKNRLGTIAWGLARQGGPNASQLARLTMLRIGPGLFLEKLLQPQCIGARNAKMRENTLQLLIFSLVTFPSSEFKVKCATDKVVAMVADRRKRVRQSALETLAVLSQIYDTEEILEASKRLTKGKQDGQSIHAAIKTRLARKLLPTVSMDGLVVYGLQISTNSPYTGADVEWIVAGSGSVSPGTGRTRGQLIAMSNDMNEQNNVTRKQRVRPASEHSISSGTSSGLLEKDERISSWKLLPQTDENDKPRKKIDRTSKSADVSKASNNAFEVTQIEETPERESKSQRPYATPKRSERKSDIPVPSQTSPYRVKKSEESSPQNRGANSAPAPRQESRIPVYTGTKTIPLELIKESHEKSSSEDVAPMDANGYASLHQRRKLQLAKSAAPRSNYTINYAHANRYINAQFDKPRDKPFDDEEVEPQKFKEDYKSSPLRNFKENNQRVLSYEKLNKGFDSVVKNSQNARSPTQYHQYSSTITDTYETIYQRQRRMKEERDSRAYSAVPSSPLYGYAYEGYPTERKLPIRLNKSGRKGSMANQSPQKRSIFTSPFDDHPFGQSTENSDKEAGDLEANGSLATRTINGSRTAPTNSASDRPNSPRHGGGEARSSSGSSSSSTRSAPSGRRTRSRPSLPAHTESDESNADRVDTSSPGKSFNVISPQARSGRRETPDRLSSRGQLDNAVDQSSTESEEEEEEEDESEEEEGGVGRRGSSSGSSDRQSNESGLPGLIRTPDKPASQTSINSGRLSGKQESLPRIREQELRLPALECAHSSDPSPSAKSSPASRSGSSERAFSARCSAGGDEDEEEEDEEEERQEEERIYESAGYRNERTSGGPGSPPRSRAYRDCERNTDSNVSLYSCNSGAMSPKNSSPKRFVSEESVPKDTDSDGATTTTTTTRSASPPPLPIGFQRNAEEQFGSSSADGNDSDEKAQPTRASTPPVELPRRICKVSPCRMRPQPSCHRTTLAAASRHHDKHHPEKSSKAVQQCFANLESKDWEMTLKGLRTLGQLARDEPEQLDVCAPGMLLRLLGKHVRNLRSQVARVACSTASDVFSAHIRGIDQDLDEIAGPLLHRTADTNRFLREDCNLALDSFIEHFPPHRTIVTIANRGATHQNTIVHATTARLLYAIVNELGADCAMLLPKDVRDKLFETTAKLLTDGNLQARKHAKETFRLLVRCEGFRKALTDAVPESTLRLIDKTLRAL